MVPSYFWDSDCYSQFYDITDSINLLTQIFYQKTEEACGENGAHRDLTACRHRALKAGVSVQTVMCGSPNASAVSPHSFPSVCGNIQFGPLLYIIHFNSWCYLPNCVRCHWGRSHVLLTSRCTEDILPKEILDELFHSIDWPFFLPLHLFLFII
jgi:hypothetical protein